MSVRHTILAAALSVGSSVLGVPTATADLVPASSVTVPAPSHRPATRPIPAPLPHPVSEARTAYHRVLFTDGCEADFRSIYVGLVMTDNVPADVFNVPSKAYPGMSHIYVADDLGLAC